MKTTKKPWKSWAQRQAAEKARRRKLLRAKLSRIKKIDRLYKRTLSLTKTGEALGLGKERVRQLLEFGHGMGVIAFFGKVDDRRLADLLARTDRAELARDLGALTRDEVCSKYGIQYSLCYKLHRYAAAGGSLVEL